ncbi:MAG: hypothetical protein PHV17_05495 [Candidatus Omnitrophica bacterium]|nr:hypothetical protein [Candidatus Omnitrophota bacterium]
MRNIIVTVLLMFMLIPAGFSQDGVYGDYLLSGIEKKVSLDLEGAALTDVIKMLSQQTGLNFVSTEIVQARRLTLYLDKVPLKEALDIIFKANNLTYDFYPDSNVFVVKEMGKPTMELKTKIYNLRYARVSTSRMSQEVDTAMETKQDGTFIKAVENVLSEFGKVTEDSSSNALIVVDVPSQFPVIDKIVAALDVPLTKIMIEVEMLDVNKNVVDKMGVEWDAALAKLDVSGHRMTNFPFFGDMANKFTENHPTFNTFTTAGGWAWSAGLPGNQFTPTVLTVIGQELALKMLRTHTDTKTIARPKIMTLANETAEIKIVTDEAIGINKEVDDDGDVSYTIEREETGTRLRVTPQLDPQTNNITLMVEMVVKEAVASGFSTTESTYITGQIKDPEERSTKGLVRLRSGETLLIGGLIKKDTTKVDTRVPILSDIPILGKAFKYKDNDATERELLVFITPRIIEEHREFNGKGDLFHREQADSLRRDTMNVALDKFSLSRSY